MDGDSRAGAMSQPADANLTGATNVDYLRGRSSHL